jgi:cell shape-determining protein MreC
MFRKKSSIVVLDVLLDRSTYDRFRAYAKKNGMDENTALVNVLERGMTNYWLQEFKQLKQSYSLLEKLFEEYSKDNEVLAALEQQNEQLQNLLDTKNQQEKPSSTKL